jgi:hypothetical protein
MSEQIYSDGFAALSSLRAVTPHDGGQLRKCIGEIDLLRILKAYHRMQPSMKTEK